MISNFCLKTVCKKILFLSSVSGSILVGMKNKDFSVTIMQPYQSVQPNGSVITLYPLSIINKKRNAPEEFYDFDRPVRAVSWDRRSRCVVCVELSDGATSRLDLRAWEN